MQKKMSAVYRIPIWENTASLAVLDLTAVAEEDAKRFSLSLAGKRAMGRAFTVAAYFCSGLEEFARFALVVDGKGAGGKISVSGNGRLEFSGSPSDPSGEAETIEKFVGADGFLTVKRDEGFRLPISGTCALVKGDIEHDIEKYFAESEQCPTAVRLFDGTKDGAFYCGGVFLQPLPAFDKKEIYRRAKEELTALPTELDVKGIFRRFGAELPPARGIRFCCSCSREKAARALLAFGRTAAESLFSEDGALTVHCHECNTDYAFGEADLEKLFPMDAE